MQSDIVNLRMDVDELKTTTEGQQAQQAEQLKRGEEKLEEVAQALQELNRAARSTDADFGLQMERLQREVQELRGSVELAEHHLRQAQEAAAQASGNGDAGSDADRGETAVSAGEGSDAASSHHLPKADKKGGAAAKNEAARGKNKQAMLNEAQELIKAEKRNEARGMLRDVLKKWPKEPGTTDVALYRLGETYFSEKKYAQAVQEYIKVVEQFPQSSMVDEAYYRIGVCSMEIGNLEDAELFFTEVVTRFKGSAVAAQAASKLKDVRARLAKEKKTGKGKKRR